MTRRVRPRRRAAVDGAEVMRTRVVAVLVFLHGASSLRVPATRRSVVTGVVLAAAPAAASAEPRRADAVFDSISQQAPAPAAGSNLDAGDAPFTRTASGLQLKDVARGSGPAVVAGDTVAVQYTGRLLNLNGKKFASTKDSATKENGGLAEPFVFVVGAKETIPGLEELVTGMSKGGVRRAIIPPGLGYDCARRVPRAL